MIVVGLCGLVEDMARGWQTGAKFLCATCSFAIHLRSKAEDLNSTSLHNLCRRSNRLLILKFKTVSQCLKLI